jgi:hypothetical protein
MQTSHFVKVHVTRRYRTKLEKRMDGETVEEKHPGSVRQKLTNDSALHVLEMDLDITQRVLVELNLECDVHNAVV